MKIHFDEIVRQNRLFIEPISLALKGDFRLMNRILDSCEHEFPAMHTALVSAYKYAFAGQQVFVVGPRLQAMLCDTDCKAVPREFLRLPFESFYIALEDSKLQIFGDRNTGMHTIEGMYVAQQDADNIVITVWGGPNDKSRSSFDDATFWFRLRLDKAPREEVEGVEVVDVESCLMSMISDVSTAKNDAFVDIQPEDHEKTIRDIPMVMRLAVNLLLYLSSNAAERDTQDKGQAVREETREVQTQLGRVKSPKKRAKLLRRQERLGEASGAVVTWIGRSIEAEGGSEDHTGSGSGWSVRRGHFHHYWTGKRVLEDGSRQKGDRLILKWAKPVYRVMNGLEAPRHEYRFADDKNQGA